MCVARSRGGGGKLSPDWNGRVTEFPHRVPFTSSLYLYCPSAVFYSSVLHHFFPPVRRSSVKRFPVKSISTDSEILLSSVECHYCMSVPKEVPLSPESPGSWEDRSTPGTASGAHCGGHICVCLSTKSAWDDDTGGEQQLPCIASGWATFLSMLAGWPWEVAQLATCTQWHPPDSGMILRDLSISDK